MTSKMVSGADLIALAFFAQTFYAQFCSPRLFFELRHKGPLVGALAVNSWRPLLPWRRALHFRLWHLTDIDFEAENFCFEG
jgi:hypothetical protein